VLITSVQDPAPIYRPLIVETPAGDIQALGKRFSVGEVESESRFELYDGELEIRPRQAASCAAEQTRQLYQAGRASFLEDLQATRTYTDVRAQLAQANTAVTLRQIQLFWLWVVVRSKTPARLLRLRPIRSLLVSNQPRCSTNQA